MTIESMKSNSCRIRPETSCAAAGSPGGRDRIDFRGALIGEVFN